VSIKHKVRTISLPDTPGRLDWGTPMRPEEIEELMHSINQPKITYTIRAEGENGDGVTK
jgi:hypothetical protein